MCTFLCFAISSDGRPSRVLSAFASRGLPLEQLPAHARAADFPFQGVFFSTAGHCDCGTPIGSGRVTDSATLSAYRSAMIEALDKSQASSIAVYHAWGESWENPRLALAVETIQSPDEFTIERLANLTPNTILVLPNWLAPSG
jgi:hypothetical protein